MKCVDLLLAKRVFFSDKGLLHVAAKNGFSGIVKLLINAGKKDNNIYHYQNDQLRKELRHAGKATLERLEEVITYSNKRYVMGMKAFDIAYVRAHWQICQLLAPPSAVRGLLKQSD